MSAADERLESEAQTPTAEDGTEKKDEDVAPPGVASDPLQRVLSIVASVGAVGTLLIAFAAWMTLSSDEDDRELSARFDAVNSRLDTVNATVDAELRAINGKLDELQSNLAPRVLRLENLHLTDGGQDAPPSSPTTQPASLHRQIVAASAPN